MGYYMRYVSTDQQPVTTADVRDALLAADAGYRIELDDAAATITYRGATLAHVEINVPGDGLFEDEREELIEFASAVDGDGASKTRVLDTIRGARGIVAVQVLFGTGDSEGTLRLLDPLWAWLFRHRDGLMQADGEGYYDARGLMLRMH